MDNKYGKIYHSSMRVISVDIDLSLRFYPNEFCFVSKKKEGLTNEYYIQAFNVQLYL